MNIRKYFAENAATIALGFMSISGAAYIPATLTDAATKEIKANTNKKTTSNYKRQVVTA